MVKCKTTRVPCPNRCGKKKVKHMKRMDLCRHLKEECPNRRYECKLCGETGTYQNLGPTHEQSCPKRKVDCPNAGCGKNMKYCQLDIHIALECEYAKIPCETCGAQVERKNWDEHQLHNAHHAIHEKNTKLTEKSFEDVSKLHKMTGELFAKTSEYSVQTSEYSTKTSEVSVKLRRELNFLRWSLIAAGVICVLLLGTVIVVLNLRTQMKQAPQRH